MPTKRYTFYGRDDFPNGFSITLCRQLNEPAGINVDPVAAKNLLVLIAACCGAGVAWNWIRETIVGTKGAGKLTRVQGAQFNGNPAKDIQMGSDAVLMQCRDSTGNLRKPIYLRGVWDSAIDDYGVVGDPVWSTAFAALVNQLKTDGWGWLGVNGKTTAPIASVAPLAANANKTQISLTAALFAPILFNRNVQVRVAGVDGIPKVKNPLLVRVTDAQTCSTAHNLVQAVNNAGQMTLNALGFYAIATIEANRSTTRDTGGPFRPSRSKSRPRLP